MKNYLLIVAFVLTQTFSFGQNLEKEWQFLGIENEQGKSLYNINPSKDNLNLSEGSFQYQLEAKDNLQASGDYIFQNKLLVFYYNQPIDTIRRYKISEHTDSTLVFAENGIQYKFITKPKVKETVLVEKAETGKIVPSEGFSINSLWRGVVGMISLLFIAFLFSNNRKAINWRTAAIGLAFQLIIAIGVLKVSFIQNGFEAVGKVFVSILDYTRAGSNFYLKAWW